MLKATHPPLKLKNDQNWQFPFYCFNGSIYNWTLGKSSHSGVGIPLLPQIPIYIPNHSLACTIDSLSQLQATREFVLIIPSEFYIAPWIVCSAALSFIFLSLWLVWSLWSDILIVRWGLQKGWNLEKQLGGWCPNVTSRLRSTPTQTEFRSQFRQLSVTVKIPNAQGMVSSVWRWCQVLQWCSWNQMTETVTTI